MTAPDPKRDAEAHAAEAASKVVRRAIWRLDVLEWVILFAAVVLAVGGAALVAPLLSLSLGVPFRWAWTLLSLFLFCVPGAIVLARVRREERVERGARSNRDGPSDG
jgi:uncharacterized membrane protein